jgi:integral membrane protein
VTPRGLFRVVAIAEAVTWTLLIAGIVLRAAADLAVAVTIGGAIHGFVFLVYGATALLTALHQRWSVGVAVLAVGAAVIPYATIPVHLWLDRSGRLRGDWRRDAGPDAGALDRLVSWIVRHPVPLALAAAAAIVALYVLLLVVGPPGR